ncbi:hypothetical protein F5B20DRAFT_586581 [Whalleya microplaca]|nr:hypothetical protein F5B20DRAFT_586581 [Whalleya microplaca]
MASSTSPPSSSPSSQQPQTPQEYQESRDRILHNVAMFVTPVAVVGMFLPPRKFDLRLVVLGGVALWGANEMLGTSIFARFDRRLKSMVGSELPERAKQTQLRLRAEREAARASTSLDLPEDQRRLLEEHRRKKEEAEGGGRNVLEKIWMGDQGADWKEKRDQREKEALSEGGGGYWGLIVDQISDVWSQGKKKGGEEGKEADAKQGSEDSESKKA